MQTLPVIIAVICAAAVIVCVLLWRVKPPLAADQSGNEKQIADEKQRVKDLQARLDAKETALRTAEATMTGAKVATDAANAKAAAAEQRHTSLNADCVKLRQDYDAASRNATASSKDADHLRKQIDGLSRSVESLQLNLTEERRQLAAALARQQTGEDAARQFENISQAVLKEALADAKRGLGEIAVTLKQTGDKELEKHADTVARTLAPLQEKLSRYDDAVASYQKGSHEQMGGLKEQLETLQKTERSLHDQAEALTMALSTTPKYRGNYGEMTLKRLVESVGMIDKCHFETQVVSHTEEGRKIPDMIITLPGEQKLIVDSKAVLNACTDAYTAQDEARRIVLLKQHSANVRSRVKELSAKNYYASHPTALDTVILFLPAESLYLSALEHDSEITDYATQQKVIICSPSSLMMLLHVANHLWRQSAIEKEVEDIRKCGNDIYKACCAFVGRFGGIGKKIQSLEGDYNDALTTLESTLLRQGKRMGGFESITSKDDLANIPGVTSSLREFKPSTRSLAATPELPGIIPAEDKTPELDFPTANV